MRALASDWYLIWRFKRGSAEAFERIYERHKNSLLKLAVVLLGDVHAAEDVVHDVFVHVARTRANLRVSGNLKSLLATSVANRARNYRRDAYRYHNSLAKQAGNDPGEGSSVDPHAGVFQMGSSSVSKLLAESGKMPGAGDSVPDPRASGPDGPRNSLKDRFFAFRASPVRYYSEGRI